MIVKKDPNHTVAAHLLRALGYAFFGGSEDEAEAEDTPRQPISVGKRFNAVSKPSCCTAQRSMSGLRRGSK